MLLAIDGNSILNRAYFGVRPLTTKEGVNTNAIFGFLNMLMKLEREFEPTAVAIAFDVSRKTFRNDQYDQYKANRKGMPPELAEQLPLIKEILALMGYKTIGCEGFEGDDILGTLSANCKGAQRCVIATGDRDCLQLINDNVSVSLAKTSGNIVYNAELVESDFGIEPKQVIELKALMGDSSDNIPGVKGVGEKTAVTLITKYKDLETIYENIDTIETTPRIRNLLIQDKNNAYMSRKLATICLTVPIDAAAESYVKTEPDVEKLSEIMTRLEMFSFFEKLNLTKTEAEPTTLQAKKTISIKVETSPNVVVVLKALNGISTVSLLAQGEKLTLQVDSIIYCVTEFAEQVLRYIADNNIGIVTFMAKPLIKSIKLLGYEAVNLRFDIELAGYLLNPSAKGYRIAELTGEYLSDTKFEVDEEFIEIAVLEQLANRLEATLKEQGMLELFNDIELPLCEVLADMEIEGFAIDTVALSEFGDMIKDNIEATKLLITELAGKEFNVNSTKELGVVLFEDLGLPTKKKTKTGYSTDIDVLESLINHHEIIPAIMEYRKLTKLHSTYVVGLLKLVTEQNRVHSTFNQTETRTGRISSTEPNVQNIPVRTKLGSEMRRFFVAREGYTLVDADYSQIELRILAHIADDKDMITAFLNGDDIHSITASQVFHCPIEELTPAIRSRAKAINFGIVYGISPFSLAQDISVSVGEAKEYMEAYFRTYSGVATYMENIVKLAEQDEFVTTLFGRKRDLPDINHSNKLVKAGAKRIALNTPIQGTAADIIKLAMVRVHRRIQKEGLEARLILQVHDELIIEAPTMQAAMIKGMLREEMENAAKLSVPLLVDVNIGENWYIAKG